MSSTATTSDFFLRSPSEGDLDHRYGRTRRVSERITEPLSAEDCVIQSMPDVSPTSWHLAHTTWFFETFILKQLPEYQVFDERYDYLFNSYYNSVGAQFPRHRRGVLSRPCVSETLEYRRYVDQAMTRWLHSTFPDLDAIAIVELGLNHEQQHQELMLTDIKHVLSCNPLFPAYEATRRQFPGFSDPGCLLEFIEFDDGMTEIGADGEGFAFDNERPRHTTYLHPYRLANRCVTNGEFLEFMLDGGYKRPELWLSLGWGQVQSQLWQSPLYWIPTDPDAPLEKTAWREYTLGGLRPLNLSGPVCHVSYFEADAYARWAGKRLPTEFEWEAASHRGEGDCFADRILHEALCVHPQTERLSFAPQSTPGHGAGEHDSPKLKNMFGGVWEWTSSPYLAYPGYQPVDGALGEYNGKFMCNQFVLRGGSCATSEEHFRPTYRNFFPPEARWQFSGIRLAE